MGGGSPSEVPQAVHTDGAMSRLYHRLPNYSGGRMVRGSRVRAVVIVALVAGIGVAGLLPSAHAQDVAWSLAWVAPPECPSEDSVRASVAQLLGEGPAPPVAVSARAVVVRTSSDHWIVQLTTVREGSRGERVVEAPSCPSLANATALIVALTIDPERVAAHTPTPGASASGAPVVPPVASASASASSSPPLVPAPPPPPSASVIPSAAPSTSAPPAALAAPPSPHEPGRPETAWPSRHFALLVEGAGDVGTLPRLSDGITGSLSWIIDPLRIEAFGTYLFPQAAYQSSLPNVGTNLHLLVGGLRGCFEPVHRDLELGACVGMELGELQGDGFGSYRTPYQAFTPSSGGSFWALPVASGRLAWRIASSFSLVLDLGIGIPIERDTFYIGGATGPSLHQASSVIGRGAVGPEVRF